MTAIRLVVSLFATVAAQDLFLGMRGARDSAKPALFGVDLVEYWSLAAGAAPVDGSPEFSVTVTSADGLNASNGFEHVFWFKDAANRDSFSANPTLYAPAWGGFCGWGMAGELPSGGWPWGRDYLGAPGNTSVWLIHKAKSSDHGRLILFFLPAARTIFQGVFQTAAHIQTGDQRWASWFGASTDGHLHGPFNTDCPGSDYGPPVVRTCCLEPQKLPGIPTRKVLTDGCRAALDTACKDNQGDNPVNSGACSKCLTTNADALAAAGCNTNATEGPTIDKVYCA